MSILTIFKNFNEIIETKTITDILNDIQQGKYKHHIIYLRKSLHDNKTEAYEKAKKALPAFTPSGIFEGGRKAELLKEYSKFIILDIDKLSKEQLDTIKKKTNESNFTYASFTSPSGNGLKILIQVNTAATQHKHAFIQAQAYYEKLLSITIDKSGKDISRLCFFSYDPNLYHNINASILQVNINQSDLNIIQNTTHNIQHYALVYEHCKRFTEKKIQYAAGNRNNFIHQLACNLNRKGIPMGAAIGYILADYNYNSKEITNTIKSAYSNSQEFGNANNQSQTLSTITINKNGTIENQEQKVSPSGGDLEGAEEQKPIILEKLEKYLNNNYHFRYNIVSGKLEFKKKQEQQYLIMNDFKENSLLRELLKARIRTNITGLRNTLNSDFCQTFNPFENYFNTLEQWDEQQDYINQLANTITTTKQERWQQYFKKWLVAMVGCTLDEKVINQTVVVFSGKQGIGKTTWLENLIPKQLKNYLFSGTINPNNKDTLIHLAECMLINLDELENLNRSEIGTLKEIITKTQIRIRKAYGHNNETMPRRASFAGSVNTAQFLNDTTGSRRFLCFEVEAIQYDHNIDIHKVYAQALHLFNNNFCYWFNQQEIKTINENNEQYQIQSVEEELLLTWFKKPQEAEGLIFQQNLLYLNTSQIAAKLAEKAKINITDSTINKLGRALKKHSFKRVKKHEHYVYAIKELNWEMVDRNNQLTNHIPKTVLNDTI